MAGSNNEVRTFYLLARLGLLIGLVSGSPQSADASNAGKSHFLYGGESVALSLFAMDNPVALIVLKGGDCPVCNQLVKDVAHLQSSVPGAKGKAAAVLWKEDPSKLSLKERNFQGIPLFRTSLEFFVEFDFWDIRHRTPVPGVLFLDRCGEPTYIVHGRSQRGSQAVLILKVLAHLAQKPSECGFIL